MTREPRPRSGRADAGAASGVRMELVRRAEPDRPQKPARKPRSQQRPPADAAAVHGSATVRQLLLRGLGATGMLATLSLWPQVDGLIGPAGLLPVEAHLRRVALVAGANPLTGIAALDPALRLPTLAWALPPAWAPHALCALAAVASALLLAGRWQGPAAAALAVAWLSLGNVGQLFLAFQWDTLLVEVAAAAALLAPWRARSHGAPPATEAAWWLLRWVLFRLMFFAGVVKLTSGDATWADLSALTHHFETQPLPNPLSWTAHHLPRPALVLAAGATFVVELVLAWGALGPRPARRVAFAAFLGLLGGLALTGNYGHFQLLSAVLCLALLDDADLPRTWPAALRARDGAPASPVGAWTARVLAAAAGLLALVQIPAWYGGASLPKPVAAAVDVIAPWRVVNRYGLFAVMTTSRPLPALEGRWGEQGAWQPLPWRYQTSAPERGPTQVAPHMPRLDWAVWFAGLAGRCERARWLLTLEARVLQGSRDVIELLDAPLLDGAPPDAVRIVLRDWAFTPPGSPGWWVGSEAEPFCPPLTREAAVAP